MRALLWPQSCQRCGLQHPANAPPVELHLLWRHDWRMCWGLLSDEPEMTAAAGAAAEAAGGVVEMAEGSVPTQSPSLPGGVLWLIWILHCSTKIVDIHPCLVCTHLCGLAMQGIQLWQTLGPSCGIRKSLIKFGGQRLFGGSRHTNDAVCTSSSPGLALATHGCSARSQWRIMWTSATNRALSNAGPQMHPRLSEKIVSGGAYKMERIHTRSAVSFESHALLTGASLTMSYRATQQKQYQPTICALQEPLLPQTPCLLGIALSHSAFRSSGRIMYCRAFGRCQPFRKRQNACDYSHSTAREVRP